MTQITEIYDLSTQTGQTNILKVHTPQDGSWVQHLKGMMMQYKKIKYNGAQISLIPVARLPADPLQVSFAPGEADIDPRDLMNPILHKYYHGERMVWDQLGDSEVRASGGIGTANPDNTITPPGFGLGQSIRELAQAADNRYDAAYAYSLMDRSFRKSHVQKGFRTICKPFMYNVVTQRQLGNQVPDVSNTSDTWAIQSGLPDILEVANNQNEFNPIEARQKSQLIPGGIHEPSGFFGDQAVLQTNKLVPLGWLDTQNFYSTSEEIGGTVAKRVEAFRLPMLYMYAIVFPRAYKNEFYFRMIISHSFSFKEFRSCKGFDSPESYMADSQFLTPEQNGITAPGGGVEPMKGSIQVSDGMSMKKLGDGIL